MSRVAARVFLPLVHFAQEQGLDSQALLAQAGVTAFDLDPDKRLSESAAACLCQLAVDTSQDTLFALKAGLAASPQSLGSLAYVLQNSPSVRAAFTQLQRYWRILHDEPLFHLKEDGGIATLGFRSDSVTAAQSRRALMEYLIGFLLTLSGSMLGVNASGGRALRGVDFRFACPSDSCAADYRRILSCREVRFSQEKTAVSFDAAVLSQRLPFADPKLLALFQRQLQTSPGFEKDSLVAQLRGLLRARFPGHLPSLPELAAELATSRASLQRRLANAGTSYREMIQALKQDTAHRLLAENRHSLAEIAFMLDFADSASFHHAYKRWTGETPLDTRRRLSGH